MVAVQRFTNQIKTSKAKQEAKIEKQVQLFINDMDPALLKKMLLRMDNLVEKKEEEQVEIEDQ